MRRAHSVEQPEGFRNNRGVVLRENAFHVLNPLADAEARAVTNAVVAVAKQIDDRGKDGADALRKHLAAPFRRDAQREGRHRADVRLRVDDHFGADRNHWPHDLSGGEVDRDAVKHALRDPVRRGPRNPVALRVVHFRLVALCELSQR